MCRFCRLSITFGTVFFSLCEAQLFEKRQLLPRRCRVVTLEEEKSTEMSPVVFF